MFREGNPIFTTSTIMVTHENTVLIENSGLLMSRPAPERDRVSLPVQINLKGLSICSFLLLHTIHSENTSTSAM